MKYCKKCVEPESNPGLTLDENEVCNVCHYYQSKPVEDWNKRQEELKEIASWAKANSTGTYDCVIGVSGGKDSHRQALYARDVLGLNCLLVSNPGDISSTDIGQRNMDNLYNHGFDVIKYYANPLVYKELVRRAIVNRGNPQIPSEYTIAAIPIRAAINFKIPLVIHGENSVLEMGEPAEFTDESNYGGSALGFANSNTVRGGQAKDLAGDGIGLKDILPYQYPSEEEIRLSGIRAIYLSYYLQDWSISENAKFAISKGLRTRIEGLYDIGRYDRFSAIDSDLNIVNGMIKYIKFGYGAATDMASFDIRTGKITREEAIALVREFDGRCAEPFVKAYCDYIELPVDEFWETVEKYRGDMWEKNGKGGWVLKNPIWEQEPPSKDIDCEKLVRRLNEELGINRGIE